jgi:TonB-dependent receptor
MNQSIHSKNKLALAISSALVSLTLMTCFMANAAESITDENKQATKGAQEEVEVIVVTGGLRASYEGAIGEKRLADTVIEAITSEDIGQFADDSIAGAIQRMPGIQIEVDQAGTDGDRVSIRGLGPQFVNSSINGRTLLSSGNEANGLRKMNFNVFPSSILSGVSVAKGQTANRPESGLAGQVDLQTIRPLDLKQLENKNHYGLISYKAEHRELTSANGGVLEGSFAWRNDDNNLGFFVGLATGETDMAFQQASETKAVNNLRIDTNGDGLEDEVINGVTVPSVSTARTTKQTVERDAVTMGLQWKPTEDINIVWDTTFAQFNNSSNRDNGQLIFTPVWGATVFDVDAVDIDDNNVLRRADFSKTTGGGAILSRMQDMTYNNETANFISGVNVNWLGDNLTTNFDVYYSDVEYSQDLRFPIFNKNLDKTLATYESLGEVPSITTGDERLVADGYTYVQSIVREIEMDAKNYGATLSFNYALDTQGLSSVDFGVHYEKTDIRSYRSLAGVFKNAVLATEIAGTLLGELVDDNFLAGTGYSPSTWLEADFNAIAELDPAVLSTGMDVLGIDPAASHDSIEEIFSLYGQVNLDLELGEMPLTGNIGLRATNTKNEATALSVGTSDDPVENTTDNDYWEYLPSINLNLAINDDLALRFGFSKTLSRPEYSEMAPIINANITDDCTDIDPDDCRGRATAGNPNLDPMTSLNYDLTLEYYNQYNGAAVVSVFYKDVNDFIINDLSYNQTIVGQPEDLLFDLTHPINFSDGEAKGYEIGFYQPFDKLSPMLTGFGVTANYTKVKSSFDEDVGDSGFGFPGSSENNYNFVGFYENEAFTARVAYVFRDDFFRSLAGQGSQTTDARFTSSSKSLSLNLRYRFSNGLSMSFNGNNLLDDDRRDYIGNKDKFLDYFSSGRNYSITTTYRF